MLIPYKSLLEKYNIRPEGVLHIGGSRAQEIKAYYDNGVSKSIWIEADPDVFIEMTEVISQYPNVQAFNICVDDVTGRQVDFFISDNGGESSSMYQFGVHSKLHPDVKFNGVKKLTTTRIDAIIKDLTGFDFLNIDLQGAELAALKSMGTLLDGFKYAYLEVNKQETYKGIPLFPEVCKFMRSKGFDLMESKWVKDRMGDDVWGDSVWFRKELM